MTDVLFWCNILIYLKQLSRTDRCFRVRKFYIALQGKHRFYEMESENILTNTCCVCTELDTNSIVCTIYSIGLYSANAVSLYSAAAAAAHVLFIFKNFSLI